MSDEMQHDDPWADDATATPADPDGINWDSVEGGGDEFDDILDSIDLEETESGEEIRVRDEAKKYDNPYDVGLKDGMWVPVRILSSVVEEKHVPRLSAKTCIAKKDGKTYVLHDQVEAALRAGGEEVIGEIPLPYFVCEANHAAPKFGQRRWDWEIEVPVFTVKTALYKPQRNRTGYMNDNGRSLRVATGATTSGDKISKANMREVAEKMVDQVVLAQVSIVQSKRPKLRPRYDETGQQISVTLNPSTGDPVAVFRQPDGSGYVADDGTGEIWEGDESLLVPLGENRFAIRDSSDTAGPLMEEYFPINDYINPPFLPLPERKVQITRVKRDENGELVQAEGEITLDTVGAIARGATAGVAVDVLLRTGETVTAVWLGTEWVEKPSSDGAGLAQFSGSDAQENALAGL